MKPVRKGRLDIAKIAKIATIARSAMRVVGGLALLAMLFTASGCDELGARRKIKDGNRLYQDGKFEEAVKAFEEALALSPDLEIGHYNLGLAYYKLFGPNPDDKELGHKVTTHLAKYLENHPHDTETRDLISKVWIDSGDYEKALAYWQQQLDANPNNRDIIEKLAGINFRAGNWERSVQWYMKEAEVAHDTPGKISAYLNVAKLAWNKLSNREATVGAVRVKIADLGIAALQLAEQLDPKNMEVEGYLSSILDFRAIAHGATWAAALDRAQTQVHRTRWRVLKEEHDKAAKQQLPQAPPAQSPEPTKGG